MSVWVVRPPEEIALEAMLTRGVLVLPIGQEWPDLSGVHSRYLLKRAVQRLHPEAAPETVNGQVEYLWPLLGRMEVEDVVVMQLPSQRIVFGEVTGPVQWSGGWHELPMCWVEKQVALWKFGKYKALFEENGRRYFEVMNANTRKFIRRQMPYVHNRFARWQWILLILIGLRLVHLAVNLWQREFGWL